MSAFRSRRSQRTRRTRSITALVVLLLGAVLGTVALAQSGGGTSRPTITSDKADYLPGSVVTLTGAGWRPGEAVHIHVVEDNSDVAWTHDSAPDPTADGAGGFTYTFTLPSKFVANYSVRATGTTSGIATTTFTDSAAKLEQCRNGSATSPQDCIGNAWVTGNAGSTQAHYVEGYSIPYRIIMTALPATSVTINLSFDNRVSGQAAIDYLTHYQRLDSHLGFGHPAETVDPASGVLGITGPTTTYPIPAPTSAGSPTPGQPSASFNAVPAAERVMTLFGGTITNVAYTNQGNLTATNSTATIAVTFTPIGTTAVLAWGGHIARTSDWGTGNSAVTINGSPYHTSLDSWNLDNLGAQDRSLSAAAVQPTGTVVIRKVAQGGNETFPYATTGSGLATSFNLTTSGGTAERIFTDVPVGDKTITEGAMPTDWTFTSLACTDPTPTGTSVSGKTATINVAAGETITCTYTNTKRTSLHLRKTVVNDNGGTATAANFTLTADGAGTNDVTGAGSADSGPGLQPGTFTLSETSLANYTPGTWSCTGGTLVGNQLTLTVGQDVTCSITNTDNAPSLTLNKIVVNDNGGAAAASAWTLTATGPTSITGAGGSGNADVSSDATFTAGTYALSESGGPGGYTASAWTCTGNATPMSGANVTVGFGESVVCSITNDDTPATLTLQKVVTNDNGGSAADTAWTLSATSGAVTRSGVEGDAAITAAAVGAGTYTLAESGGPAGYAAGTWSCTGATVTGNQVTIGLGDQVTCSITNDDIAPKLHLRKVVTNDNGGTKQADDFALTANGTGANDLSGNGSADSDATLHADTFTLSETPLAGYSASAWVCRAGTADDGALLTLTGGDTLTLGLGDEATCTITNNDIAPSLTLTKTVVNDNGGTAQASDWELSASATGGSTEVVFSGNGSASSGATFTAGTYTLGESGPAGYDAGAWVCDGTELAGNQVTLALGQSMSCAITNDDTAPKLTLNKVVVNDNGGTAVESEWTLSATKGTTVLEGPGAAGDTDVVSTTAGALTDGPLTVGTYTLAEADGPDGYTPSKWTCNGVETDGTVSLALGDDVTCTIVNDDSAPKLTLNKIVINNNGGTLSASTVTVTATGTLAGNTVTGLGTASSSDLQADTFTLSESATPGYSASAWNCGATPVDGNEVTLGIGADVTCSVTNDDVAPKLHLRKQMINDNGGTKLAEDVALTADGTDANDLTGNGSADSDGTLKADTFTLSEVQLAGYSAGSWVCRAGTADDGDPLTLTGGDTLTLDLAQEATCTITNDDIAPKLTLDKIVVNDNGGTAHASDWTLSATGPVTVSGLGADGSSDVASGADLAAGTYTLAETGDPTGYATAGWSCVGGTLEGDQLTIGLADQVTCSIINDDIAPKLTLDKRLVTDNGGTAVESDWELSATGPTSLSGLGAAGATDVQSGADFTAGTYTLAETPLSDEQGYTASKWTCGSTQTDGTVTLAPGDDVTCWIENNDIAPTLTLNKVVQNNNGGSAVESEWQLRADGPSTVFGPGSALDVDVTADETLKAGTYTLSETGSVDGYTASEWSCSGGSLAGDQLTLALGDHAACTIVNDDNAPSLTITKKVTNDNGGTAVATDWKLTAAKVGGGATVSGDGGATDPNAIAGDYTLSESAGPAGYAAGAWSCSGGTLSGDVVTVALGATVNCEITNDDIGPALTLVKTVTNTNGGTAVATDWKLSATHPVDGGDPVVVQGDGGGSGTSLMAGDYTLAESGGPAGYSAGDWNCDGGTLTGTTLTLGLADNVTCTIVNDDDPAKLTLVKHVTNDNGGGATAADWTLSATQVVDPGATGAHISGDGGASSSALPVGTYTLAESSGPSGYTPSKWTCNGAEVDGSVTLALGDDITCTITNDDNAPKLTLDKIVTNDNGGTAAASAWTLTATGPVTVSGEGADGSADVVSGADLKAGTYTLAESGGPTGYTASKWTCNGVEVDGSVTLALGDDVTCAITNNDKAPKLTLNKVVVNNNGGTAAESAWTLSATGPVTVSGNGATGATDVVSGANLKAGTYTLAEAGGPSGYATAGWSCVGGSLTGSDLTIGLGDTVTCTITNDDIAPVLHLSKTVINDNGGTLAPSAFALTANGTGTNDVTGNGVADSTATLQADTFALSEVQKYGYTASAWTCVGGTQNGASITLGIGQSASCSITNNDQPATIVIKKITKPLNTGNFAFTATGSGLAGFSLAGGTQKSLTVNAGKYTVTESTQLGWILTGIGGSTNPDTPYNCEITGSGGSTGTGSLDTRTVAIDIKNGDTVTCTFENTGQGVTRTQGFWQTHPQLAQIAWFGGTAYGHTFPGVAGTTGIGDRLICGRPVDTLGKLMGGFWSDIAKTSTGGKRTALDQARMQLLQQLLAAELNASAFGTMPSGGSGMFATWEAALCGTNTTAIKNAQSQAAAFNTMGDSASFTPGTSAQSKYARSIASVSFWDIIKP